ncbi:hypothetical protein N0V84_007565 [Fusarium piperis]|uniref:RING-type domain-containing protein n=1 Tax=Fusarium piperis TaxID=1435070 RepID=A0A9W8W9R6_9HYPO|nr:hypothetical protein N0V84_007565 [Fusarium piperis]
MSSDETHENATASPTEGDLIDECYWPRLREVLEKDPSGMERLDLECMICKLPMTVEPQEIVWNEGRLDHRALNHQATILLCGHLVGLRCIYDHFEYRRSQNQPLTCPLNIHESLSYPKCGCVHLGLALPHKVEDFKDNPRTLSEGLVLMPKCALCTLEDVSEGLTILTGVFEPELLGPLKSMEVVYRIRVREITWGEIMDDERENAEIELPASVRELCRNLEASLATALNRSGRLMKVSDVKKGIPNVWIEWFGSCPGTVMV